MQGRLLPPVGTRIQAFPAEGWPAEFALAAEVGLDCIEFIFEGDDPLLHPLMDEKGLGEIRRLQSETDVMVYSVCADYFMEHPLHGGDAAGGVSVLKGLIENCSGLAVRDIVIPCVDQSRLSGREDMDALVSAVGQCLPLAEEHGINLALETDLQPGEFASLLKKFGSDRVTANYDIGNSASLGYDPREELAAYGRLITDVHVKDRLRGGGTVPLGSGAADFGAVFAGLKGLGFAGPMILQAARREPGRETETVREYIEFVRKYLRQGVSVGA
jgi:hexulose-6-phosphate isomerase